MTAPLTAYTGARIFDGHDLLTGHALVVHPDGIPRITPLTALPTGAKTRSLNGGILSPGFVDLQVNGGGGVMLNSAPDLDTLRTMAAAHRRLGTRAFLPTLITDTPAHSRAAIAAVAEALHLGMAGIAGLHLEGPHLSVARKGAHEGSLIRPLSDDDMAMLTDAVARIPNLMMTLAPENATPDQIAALTQAGVLVSLGHSDCDYDTAMRAFDAGARMATHLFNAMSQANARSPGLVGAALDHPRVASGLIADGVHVHPAMIRAALAANRGAAEVFLVTDAMATGGSDITSFTLNDREILRSDGRLTLADGTLAGADLTLLQAVRYMHNTVDEPLERALARATVIPAQLLAHTPEADRVDAMIWINDDLSELHWLTDL
ncbi:N-acetylglucosamine-6-phosphate deacetylase [Sulfitobacter sp. M39]|uniref:N-acetylglucosamine-6-phosphate deacetylase n=1 Tax=Sulfitobacter sp. M39 TaxID=2675334 RepID=UPI001EFF953F|nr:N-acetylglucosamine-6-phosphate deacetylase [Sulfitobacter sp. M39]MCF7746808.1 N-acetylglucosamine-6-phosphate deacetylase [Sulfitobacter sp. M39]